MKAYNCRRQSREQRLFKKGAMRVSFVEKNENDSVFLTEVKRRVVIISGLYHLSFKKKGMIAFTRIVERG